MSFIASENDRKFLNSSLHKDIARDTLDETFARVVSVVKCLILRLENKHKYVDKIEFTQAFTDAVLGLPATADKTEHRVHGLRYASNESSFYVSRE